MRKGHLLVGQLRPMSIASTFAFACAVMANPVAAQAQADVTQSNLPDQAASEAGNPPEIVITGTRIVQDGTSSPTPLTVVSQEQLTRAAPSTLADGLAQLPQFRASSRPGAPQGMIAGGQGGANSLNLRGLGLNRTLTLLDGRRTVGQTTLGNVDIDTYPQLLVKRVDIVTGGASAAYGSDAVAGVVNFVLDTRYVGIKADINAGISRYHDGGQQKAGFAFGTAFADDRLHVVGSFDYFKSDGIDTAGGRKWAQGVCTQIRNPTPPPTLLLRCGVTSAVSSFGGVIVSPTALANTQFLPGGVSAPFALGALRTASTMVGGDGDINQPNLQTGLEHETGFVHATFEASDRLSLFVEGSLARARNDYRMLDPFNSSANYYFTIFNDNAYLPADIRSRMAAAGVTSFKLGRTDRDFGELHAEATNTLKRGAVGLDGEFGSSGLFKLYYTYGQNRYDARALNSPLLSRLFEASDAVVNPGNGAIVCRSTLTTPGNGCVPVNLFGEGAPSPGALQYFESSARGVQTVRQHTAAANVQSNLFALPGGSLKVAAGLEYRHEYARKDADPESLRILNANGMRSFPTGLVGTIGNFFTGQQDFIPAHSYDVTEGYAELLAPVFRDAPLARELTVDLAYRYADYSTVGGISSWKGGVIYRPLSDIMVRATRSRDVRAPNLAELYTTVRTALMTVTDPFKGGTPVQAATLAQGNVNLDAERADTLSYGAVVTPSWLPGFAFSIDRFDIKIQDAITSLTAQTTLDQCFKGATELCALITRNAAGDLASIALPGLNAARQQVNGFDFESSYTAKAEWLGSGGRLSIRGLASYFGKRLTNSPSTGDIDLAGSLDGRNGGYPKWTGLANIALDNDQVSLFVQARYIDGIKLVYNYVEGVDVDVNRAKSVTYFDVTARINATKNFQFYGTVNNLFDVDPPLAPERITTTLGVRSTSPTLYDVLGRYLTVGARMTF